MYHSQKSRGSHGSNGTHQSNGTRLSNGTRQPNGRNRFGSQNQQSKSRRSGKRFGSFDPSQLIKKASLTQKTKFGQQNSIGGSGQDTPEQNTSAPIQKPEHQVKNQFATLDIHEQLKQNITDKGYKTPTPIQDRVIPHILDGKDVIGLARTGTGKTAAFLIPLISNLIDQKVDAFPKTKIGRVLIMAPTRELAVQIDAEFKFFAKNTGVYSSLCIGGSNINRQITSLRHNPEFVIGTPGRLIDLEKRHIFNFRDFSAIVLDEVDQMFDMGFVHDMKYVISRLPKERHSLFFSATLSSRMDDIAHSFLNNPIKIQIETQKASENVEQSIVKINGQSKIDLLHDILIEEGSDKVLVFGRTKHGLDKLARILFKKGFKVAAIHGNKSQGQRQRSLRQFKNNQVQILLATDIASRGLDIDNVTHVINFDLPRTYEDYIHRIGRTGRADKTGKAMSFVD